MISVKEGRLGRRICLYWQWRRTTIGILAMIAIVSLTGCQLAQSSFSQTVNNAGAVFSAATLTLDYVHSGKITTAYARSAFMNYQSELQGLDQQLSSQSGAPNPRTVQALVTQYKSGMIVINQPCLSVLCNWHFQLKLLRQASQAFLRAGAQ